MVSVQSLIGQRRGGAGRHLVSDLGESATVTKSSFHGWSTTGVEIGEDDSFFRVRTLLPDNRYSG